MSADNGYIVGACAIRAACVDRKDSREQLTDRVGGKKWRRSIISGFRYQKIPRITPAPPRHHCEITGQHTYNPPAFPTLPPPSRPKTPNSIPPKINKKSKRCLVCFHFIFIISYQLPHLQNLSSNLFTENGDIKLFRIFLAKNNTEAGE